MWGLTRLSTVWEQAQSWEDDFETVLFPLKRHVGNI